MSETKWTPPPWKVVHDPEAVSGKWRIHTQEGETEHFWGDCLATVYSGEADARLMAASRDMYTVCEAALEHVTDALLYPDDDELVMALRDALAKARSEEVDDE